MSDINLYNLSLEELKEQARILGIAIRGNPSADTLREKIREAVNIEPAADAKPVAEEDLNRKKDWITVVIAGMKTISTPYLLG